MSNRKGAANKANGRNSSLAMAMHLRLCLPAGGTVTQTATGAAFGTFMRWLFVPLLSLGAGIAVTVRCGPVLLFERLFELANGVAQAGAPLLHHDSSSRSRG